MKPRLIAVHLLNDRSGSPLVLRHAIEVLQDAYDVTLFTATPSGDGFLSDMPGVRLRRVFYRWSKSRMKTLVFFLWAQIVLFVKLLGYLRRGDSVYVNTLLPCGAALAAKLRRCRVVYHVHEVSLRPELLRRILFRIANATADHVLFVSNYVAGQFQFTRPKTEVIYNALPASFTAKAARIERLNACTPFTVLMLCSLKAYKGLAQFLQIADRLPYARFQLVLNASQQAVDAFSKAHSIPDNCELFPAQQDTIPFYQRAHVVLNLSLPDGWIETFGMTVLEAIYCGRPVIVPPVGGVCELVTDGQQGYCIDSRKVAEVAAQLQALSSDFSAYRQMSDAAHRRAMSFGADVFGRGIKLAFAYPEHQAATGRKSSLMGVLADDDHEMLFQ